MGSCAEAGGRPVRGGSKLQGPSPIPVAEGSADGPRTVRVRGGSETVLVESNCRGTLRALPRRPRQGRALVQEAGPDCPWHDSDPQELTHRRLPKLDMDCKRRARAARGSGRVCGGSVRPLGAAAGRAAPVGRQVVLREAQQEQLAGFLPAVWPWLRELHSQPADATGGLRSGSVSRRRGGGDGAERHQRRPAPSPRVRLLARLIYSGGGTEGYRKGVQTRQERKQ